MTTPSFKTAEVLDAAWFAPAGGALVPASAGNDAVTAPEAQDAATKAGRRIWPRVLRVARDLVLGMALVAAIPLTVIGVRQHAWSDGMTGIRELLVEVERLRPLMAPVDATITPDAAGAAMRRLLPVAATPMFPVHAGRVVDEPWQAALPAGLFDDMRSTVWNGPDATRIIAAAGKGLSQREREWLATLAESPIWQDVDLVARAARVDVLGQRYQVPFRDDALASAMPVPPFMRSRPLAYAGVARAAHYVSIGDHARAEAALRAIVSFGFALLDDGTTGIEGLIGRVVVDAGRSGLRQLYSLDGRGELLALTDPMGARAPLGSVRPPKRSAATLRDIALRNVADPALPRSFRFEQLSMVAWSTCGDIRSVLLGPSDEAQRTFAVARQTLAQSDAERQYIDLLERNVSAMPQRQAPPGLVSQIVQGAAIVTSTVTGNPRIASCTAAVGEFGGR